MSTTRNNLFHRLGGKPTVTAVVEEFYERVLSDPELAPFFENTNMEQQARHQVAFISVVIGGPSLYTGKSMREAHRGLGIQERHFGLVAGHLQATLEAAGVGDEDVQAIMSAAASLQDDVLDR